MSESLRRSLSPISASAPTHWSGSTPASTDAVLKRSYRRGSVEAMVATLPGVAGAGELSGRYSVRGGSYDENTVYVNGVEIYRPMLVASQQAEGLSVVNPEMTASVGFSSGGFAARYADRMSSVLDVAYRRPQAFEGSATVSMMGGALTLGQGSERFAQLHGVRYKRNTSVLSTSDTKGEYDPDFSTGRVACHGRRRVVGVWKLFGCESEHLQVCAVPTATRVSARSTTLIASRSISMAVNTTASMRLPELPR